METLVRSFGARTPQKTPPLLGSWAELVDGLGGTCVVRQTGAGLFSAWLSIKARQCTGYTGHCSKKALGSLSEETER